MEKPKLGCLFAALDGLLGMNLRVLHASNRPDLLLRQLNAMERWTFIPAVMRLKKTYQEKLEQAYLQYQQQEEQRLVRQHKIE